MKLHRYTRYGIFLKILKDSKSQIRKHVYFLLDYKQFKFLLIKARDKVLSLSYHCFYSISILFYLIHKNCLQLGK